jgi:hypothetical protein
MYPSLEGAKYCQFECPDMYRGVSRTKYFADFDTIFFQKITQSDKIHKRYSYFEINL